VTAETRVANRNASISNAAMTPVAVAVAVVRHRQAVIHRANASALQNAEPISVGQMVVVKSVDSARPAKAVPAANVSMWQAVETATARAMEMKTAPVVPRTVHVLMVKPARVVVTAVVPTVVPKSVATMAVAEVVAAVKNQQSVMNQDSARTASHNAAAKSVDLTAVVMCVGRAKRKSSSGNTFSLGWTNHIKSTLVVV